MADFNRLKRLPKLGFKDSIGFLVCLALSFMFWCIITLGERFERTYQFPVKLINVPENAVVTTNLPENIHVTLKDRGVNLLSYMYQGGLPTIKIDFAAHDKKSGHVVIKQNELLKLISPLILPTSTASLAKIDAVEYYYNYGLHAKFPVELKANLETEKFFSVSGIKLVPDSVTVYASKEILDTLTKVYTMPVSLTNLQKRTVKRISLEPMTGAKIEPHQILLRVDVGQITEKTVQVPVRFVNFPATKALRTFPSSVKVTFQVPTSMYKRINSDDFVIVVNYEDVLKATGEKLRISLKRVPSGVYHVRVSPEYVDYLVEDVHEEH